MWSAAAALRTLLPLLAISSTTAIATGQKKAVIVGGGPAGLAAALTLSKLKDFQEIIILENDANPSYDPARAYFYNINKRGQRLTDRVNIDLSERGVGVTEFGRMTVPADPSEKFDGIPFKRDMTPEERAQMGTMYWIPRHELVQLLMDCVHKEEHRPKIQLCLGTRCKHVEPTEDGRVRIVGTRLSEDGTTETEMNFEADLCVGADGLSSAVRQSLADGRFEGWNNSRQPAKNFRLKQWVSPSTGLRIKGLKLLPNFLIPVGDGSSQALETNYNYGLVSQTTGPTDSLSLVLLPQKDAASARPINICTMPNHDLWKMKDGATMKAYFTKAFPRFDWDTVVAPEEWDAFSKTEGSMFPKCQYCPRLHVSSKTSGVVLIGDALHAFPPDLGQGVNSAFCDVVMLGDCLSDATKNDVGDTDDSTSTTIPNALEQYEKQNGPETRALIALARCGAPFQYNQPSRIMKFRKTLWTMNVALRLLLNKVTMGLSPKPAILTMMNSSLSFRQVMRRANAVTLVLWAFFVSALWKVALCWK